MFEAETGLLQLSTVIRRLLLSSALHRRRNQYLHSHNVCFRSTSRLIRFPPTPFKRFGRHPCGSYCVCTLHPNPYTLLLPTLRCQILLFATWHMGRAFSVREARMSVVVLACYCMDGGSMYRCWIGLDCAREVGVGKPTEC